MCACEHSSHFHHVQPNEPRPIAGRATRCSTRRWSCAGRSSGSPRTAGRCRRRRRFPRTMSSSGRSGRAGVAREILAAVRRRGKDTLAVYSFMFGPESEQPCPGCTHFLDALDGAARHILQRINFVVVAKSPLPRLLDLARKRGWRNLRAAVDGGNTYDRDYFGDSTALPAADARSQQEFTDGEEWDMPILNVFRRDGDTIRHFWGSRAALRAARARPGIPPQRSAQSAVEHARPHAGGPRRFRTEAHLRLTFLLPALPAFAGSTGFC